MSLFHDQMQFLQAGDVPCGTVKSEELAENLQFEELGELWAEDYYTETGNINAVKEAFDMVYVSVQRLNAMVGPDKALEVWDAGHANNMSKCTNGKLVKREDGKVLKPEGYKKLDLSTIL